MERQLDIGRAAASGAAPALQSGAGPDSSGLEALLAEADRILDGLKPIQAEDYLQRSRQRGGQ